jgi:3-hydroxyisobutyrate dehydrogenase-like beta-hydroxyacid dehydrogenase
VRLGFCGLGNMGRPMAARLVGAGHDVTVWNRTPDRAAALAGLGATVAGTPAAAASGAEAVVTMLADGSALEAVVHGTDGVAAAMAPGSTLIDMSTVGPDAIRSVAGRLPPGVDALDAPVKGGPARAERGELRILVGGRREVFERCLPVFAPLGTVTYVGPLGMGAAAKLVNNFAVITLVAALGEAAAVARRLGLDDSLTEDVLAATPLAATLERQWGRATGERPVSFRLRLAEKDLALAVDAASLAGSGIGAAALAQLQEGVRRGLGDEDVAAVIRLIRDG